MSKKRLNLSLRQKLLIPTTLILSFTIIGLSLAMMGLQQRQLKTLNESILFTVKESNTETNNNFGRLDENVKENMQHMSKTVGDVLAVSTQEALEQEKQTIMSEWEASLRQSFPTIF
jgi:hypothetical protein